MNKSFCVRHIMRKLAAAVLTTLLSAAVALSQTLTFAVVGDTGVPNADLKAIAKQMSNYHTNKARFEFVLLLGDNIYEDGVGQGLAVHFEDPFKGLLDSRVKFYAVLGNHDITEPEGIQMQTNYPNFNMGGRHFYSFKTPDGLVEFFALDSTALSEKAEELVDKNLRMLIVDKENTSKKLNALGATASKPVLIEEKRLAAVEAKIAESEQFLTEIRKVKKEQMPWLEEALAGSSARWKIVFLHHAIFSSAYKNRGHGRDPDVLRLRSVLNPLFVKHKVDVVFGGHDHVFEKTKAQVSPVTNHKITYMTSGSGSKLRLGDLDRQNSFFEFGEDLKRSFLVVRLGVNKMDVDVIDQNGQNIFPTFSITKP